MVQDELHHHRLDPHLHEGGRAAETRRLDLLGPARDTTSGKGRDTPAGALWGCRAWGSARKGFRAALGLNLNNAHKQSLTVGIHSQTSDQVQVWLTGQEELGWEEKGEWDRCELRLIHSTPRVKSFLLTHFYDWHSLRQCCCTNLLWPLRGFFLEQGVSPSDPAE